MNKRLSLSSLCSHPLDSKYLEEACDLACKYDRTIIVEEAINAREIECSVLGNDDPIVSVPGEIIPDNEFYDYDAKYTPGKTKINIPAGCKAGRRHPVSQGKWYGLRMFTSPMAALFLSDDVLIIQGFVDLGVDFHGYRKHFAL